MGSIGTIFWIFLIIVKVLWICTLIGSSIWLMVWIDSNGSDNYYYLTIYTILSASYGILAFIRAYMIYSHLVFTTTKTHN